MRTRSIVMAAMAVCVVLLALAVTRALNPKPVGAQTQPTFSGVGVGYDVEPIAPRQVNLNTIPLIAYSAKFLGGTILPPNPLRPEVADPLVPGTYRTAINVRNPSWSNRARIRKYVVIANREDAPFGPVTKPVIYYVGPTQGFEIDYQDVLKLLGPNWNPNQFIKGWVVLESDIPLDVTGVYTMKNVEPHLATTG